jgi:hypothetical protein
MSVVLRIVLVVISMAFLVAIVRLVARGRLQLKYSLLWIVLGLFMIACSLFPGMVAFLSRIVAIETPANFVFFAGMGLLMLICVSLTIIVSWQAHDIRSLIQRIALLEKEIYEREGKEGLPCE